jgi:hypothetical protein
MKRAATIRSGQHRSFHTARKLRAISMRALAHTASFESSPELRNEPKERCHENGKMSFLAFILAPANETNGLIRKGTPRTTRYSGLIRDRWRQIRGSGWRSTTGPAASRRGTARFRRVIDWDRMAASVVGPELRDWCDHHRLRHARIVGAVLPHAARLVGVDRG